MSDYDNDPDSPIAVDSSDDDDGGKLTGRLPRFRYSTFDNEEEADRTEEDAIYGVFANKSSTLPPMFVQGATMEDTTATEDDDKLSHNDSKEVNKTTTPPTDKDERTKQEEEELQKRSKEEEEAKNEEFRQLLRRAQGSKKRKRSTLSTTSSEPQQQQVPPPPTPQSIPPDNTIGPPPSFGRQSQPNAETVKIDPNLGKWEKHTKGIGMKLLTKMGYKGSGGLGKRRLAPPQATEATATTTTPVPATEPPRSMGISRPVQVVVRPNQLGLGFGNFQEATQLKSNQQIERQLRGLPDPPKPKQPQQEQQLLGTTKSSALASVQDLLQTQSWKKNRANKTKKQRIVVPYTELLQDSKPNLVIDMRGPSQHETAEPALAEELLHNVSLWLNTYENKIHSAQSRLQSTRRKFNSLTSDVNDMRKRQTETTERIDKLNKVLQLLDQIETSQEEDIPRLIRSLGETFTEEERSMLQFDQVLAPSLLEPLLEQRLNGWDPFEQQNSTISSVMDLCWGPNEEALFSMKMTVLRRYLLPKIASALESTKWDPTQQVEPALQLYESLLRTAQDSAIQSNHTTNEHHVLLDLPEENKNPMLDLVQEELMHKTIYPKLARTLSHWKPEWTGAQLANRLDLWLLPWLPHFAPSILPTLVSDGKRKLRSALSALHKRIQDHATLCRACLDLLRPWKNLLKPESLHKLTSEFVTPRLAKLLSLSSVLSHDLDQHDWEPLQFAQQLEAHGLLSPNEYLSLLEADLLVPWASVLHKCLTSGTMGVLQATKCYMAWKRRILLQLNDDKVSSPCCRDEGICGIFYSVLLMVQAVKSDDKETLDDLKPPPISFRRALARRVQEAREKAQDEHIRLETEQDNGAEARVRLRRRQGAMPTFREVVEEFAKERDILFQPKMGAKSIQDGKQVFLFGPTSIYLDSNVVFALQKQEWSPVSLDQLAGMSSKR